MVCEDFRFHTSLTSPLQNLYPSTNIIRGTALKTVILMVHI